MQIRVYSSALSSSLFQRLCQSSVLRVQTIGERRHWTRCPLAALSYRLCETLRQVKRHTWDGSTQQYDVSIKHTVRFIKESLIIWSYSRCSRTAAMIYYKLTFNFVTVKTVKVTAIWIILLIKPVIFLFQILWCAFFLSKGQILISFKRTNQSFANFNLQVNRDMVLYWGSSILFYVFDALLVTLYLTESY